VYRNLLAQELADIVKLPQIAPTPLAERKDKRPSLKKGGWRDLRLTLMAQTIALLLANPELAAVAQPLATDWQRSSTRGVDILKQLFNTLIAHPELTTAMLLERWREHPHFGYLQWLSVHPFLRDLAEADVAAEFRDGLNRLSAEVREAEQFRPFQK
ncbi:MAG: DNA primase, partial [Chromatium okenii]|nr:DNA primase [Chromatium okenii]